MALRFYNTLTRDKVDFSPIDKNEVKMYSCGPTVYNYPHIGNYRAYVFADILKRTLMYSGYKVRHIMNLTDVDDKTIRDSQQEGKTLKEFTEFYTAAFYKDIKSLNIYPPVKFTKATDYIDEMVTIIDKLLAKGLAYKSADGSVYYDINKFKDYGRLAHLVLSEQKENASGRIKTDEYDKENAQDFALWKAWDEADGNVFWNTLFCKGRPGWHIECSAMSMTELGEQLDIHTGGVDNIFPHHENEIAQSEGATGKQFVKYWMHNEWVLVDQKKMSKSLHNFYNLRDLEKKNINPLAYRLWLLTSHYRTRVNFVWENLEGTENALKRLYNSYLELLNEDMGEVDKAYQHRFKEFMEDDLDTPKALALLFDLFKDKGITDGNKKATVLDFDKILGLGFENLKKEKVPEAVERLAKERIDARLDKDFSKSDELRKKINSLGYEIKDTSEGQKISKL